MTLEDEFYDELLALYWKTGREIGYWAQYYLRGVRNNSDNRGLAYVRRLLLPGKKIHGGLQRLIDKGKTHLSVEALVLDPRFSCLFTSAETAEARRRLR
jgi:hypothetical protein